jgi:hypothetical protein
MSRIFGIPYADVYPLYVKKLERKDRTSAELDQVTQWLLGYSPAEVQKLITAGTTCKDFVDKARLNPAADMITGVICGVKVQEIEDPTMQRIRYLDKLVDELFYGKSMEKVLRG